MHEADTFPKEVLAKMKAIIDHHHQVATQEEKC
jgi:hypothetical protein